MNINEKKLIISLIFSLMSIYVLTLRYGVVSTAAPRVATENAANGQVKAFEWSMLLYGFNGILWASGGESTHGGKQRRNSALIEAYGGYKQTG